MNKEKMEKSRFISNQLFIKKVYLVFEIASKKIKNLRQNTNKVIIIIVIFINECF